MSAITVKVEAAQTTAELAAIAKAVGDTAGIHARMAGDTERWVKGPDVAGKVSAAQHRTANKLGAAPTKHLEKAYQDIEGQSDAESARLLVPSHSRLRAAFGEYTVRPGPGKKWLTIPITAEAYGKRAREIDGLAFIYETGAQTALLVKKASGGRTYKPYFLLVKKATIPEDQTLIPFPELEEVARLAVGDYIDDALETSNRAGGTPALPL
jgi:hypothetical protein